MPAKRHHTNTTTRSAKRGSTSRQSTTTKQSAPKRATGDRQTTGTKRGGGAGKGRGSKTTGRSTTRKTTARKSTGKKTTTPKTTGRKTTGKKTTTPKTTGRKTTGKKTTAPAKGKKTTSRKRATRGGTKVPVRTGKSGTTKRKSTSRRTRTGSKETVSQITLQPMLAVPDIESEIAFLEALGFESTMKMPGPDGGVMHAVLTMNNAMVHLDPIELPGMPAPENPDLRARMAASQKGPLGVGMSLYVQVEDVEKVHRTIQDLGALVIQPPTDQFWGDRTMMAVDPAGYWWSFAQHIRDVAPEDMTKAMEMAPPTM